MTAGRTDIADDVVAEAFARLLVHDDRVRDPVAWLYRTTFRLAARELRREGALRPISESGAERAGVVDHPLSDELVAAMRSLSPSQRVVVFLHYKADLPVREIAELTGSSVTAVKVRLHRGRRALEAALRDGEAPGA